MPDAVPKVTAEELKRADANAVTLIDVRRKPDRQQIRGAHRYNPEKLMEAEELDLPLPHDGTIVVYCAHGNSCPAIAQRLRDEGYENAVYLEGGYEAAKAANLPLEELTQGQPIPDEPGAGIKDV